ncbi:MAG: hypothetical protein ABGZ17_12340 [Planctomycetaceae bacterium]
MFVLWLWLRWDSFVVAGIVTQYVGGLMFAIGMVCLTIHVLRNGQSERGPIRRCHKPAIIAGLQLIANVPVAAVYAVTVLNVHTRFDVAVSNETDQSVETFVVTGGGLRVDFGTIPPQATVRRSFHILRDGELSYRCQFAGGVSTGKVEGYVTHGLGGNKSIVIKPNGTIEVGDKDGT